MLRIRVGLRGTANVTCGCWLVLEAGGPVRARVRANTRGTGRVRVRLRDRVRVRVRVRDQFRDRFRVGVMVRGRVRVGVKYPLCSLTFVFPRLVAPSYITRP